MICLLYTSASNPRSRWQQKQAIKKQYAAAKHAGQTAGNTAQAASKTGKAARTEMCIRDRRYCFRVLSDYYHLLRRWKRDYAPKRPEEAWHPLFVEALQKQSHVEYLLDVLLSPDMEERAVLIVDLSLIHI